MVTKSGSSLLIALLVGTGVAVSGCNRPNSPDTVGQKVDSTADRVAAATSNATNRAVDAVDDTAITTKVKAAIMAEPGLKSLDIGVDTKNAVVTLSGTVDSPPLKDRAKQLASSVSGVREVVDNLVTKSG